MTVDATGPVPDTGSALRLQVVPITLAEANTYVEALHRHSGRLPSAKFAVACVRGVDVVGVAIAGIPKARLLHDGGTLEVNRVCTDGTRNVCSKLYGACVRVARALGYWRVITYTLEREAGASLKASGWTHVSTTDGGGWSRPKQPWRNSGQDAHDLGPKNRWEIVLGSQPVAVRWPAEIQPVAHPSLFDDDQSGDAPRIAPQMRCGDDSCTTCEISRR